MTTRVLILDANQRSALAAVRSLGKRNLTVYTADDSIDSLAGASRYTYKNFQIVSPQSSVKQFIEQLSDLIESENIDVLLPMTDASIQAVLLNRTGLPDVRLPYPDYDLYESVSNKASLFKYATEANIPSPLTYYIEDIGTIPDILKSVNCRLVIKPYKSKIYIDNRVVATEVLLPHTNQEIPGLLERYSWLKQHPFMLQQYIEGYGKGLFAIYNRGEPVAYFSHKRIREKPPQGGVSVVSRSEPVDKELVSIADRLLRDRKWHGVAMIEFKIDKNGTPYLMEINARFWGTLQLAIDSGVDFPYLLYQIAMEETPQHEQGTYKKSTLRWLLGDLDRLYLVLKAPLNQYGVTRKLVEILRFLIPWVPGMHYETFRLTDVKPFLRETRNYLRDLLS